MVIIPNTKETFAARVQEEVNRVVRARENLYEMFVACVAKELGADFMDVELCIETEDTSDNKRIIRYWFEKKKQD